MMLVLFTACQVCCSDKEVRESHERNVEWMNASVHFDANVSKSELLSVVFILRQR